MTMHTEEQSRRFQIPLGKGRFRKASFSWRICVDSGSHRRNKAALLNFLRGVDWVLVENWKNCKQILFPR